VELNAAIALAMSGDVRSGLSWVNALERRGVLRRYHLLPAAKAALLERAGHLRRARRYYAKARTMVTNECERRHVDRKIAALDVRTRTSG